MTESQFSEYSERSISSYAAESPKYRDLPRAEAIELVRIHFFTNMMPQGFQSPGHLLFNIIEKGQRIGHLHLGEVLKPGSKTLHAWDFLVYEAFRGKGSGRRAMDEASRVLKGLGYQRVTLNVMGGNAAAIHLYHSMGFEISQMQMTRPLA